jgi:hypothetical protein
MNLSVHFMALLIARYLIIQLHQMERIYMFRMLYWTWCTNICKICCFSITNLYESTFVGTSILYKLLYFKNIGLYIYNWGFNTSEIIDSSLLNSLLLNWDSILDKEYFTYLHPFIFPQFSQNIENINNKWLFFNNLTNSITLHLNVYHEKFINWSNGL